MNWLAHLFLSDDDVEHRIGNVIADWVKGEARAQFSPGIRRGFSSHRLIDLYTDAHPAVARSKARIEPPFKRYAAVLVDVFYDHFLAVEWERYCNVPLRAWITNIYAEFAAYWDKLPEQVRLGLQRMATDDWLGAYTSLEGIEAILKRMSRRLSRPNLLGEATPQLSTHYAGLRDDFHTFFPQLQAHVRSAQASA
ncbi:MAG: acyl carrier protein phosphodiesterase [Anaerolineae bacterium]|jgi:acyl carrier protein phosphodiesterase|nr:acyl carrier protein phosphodiesterase [Anaerolineae bacterium]